MSEETKPPSARVPFEVIRQGQHHTLAVAIAERPTEEELARLNGVEDENATQGEDSGGKQDEGQQRKIGFHEDLPPH